MAVIEKKTKSNLITSLGYHDRNIFLLKFLAVCVGMQPKIPSIIA